MAIIEFGPTIVGARGSFAGTIFSANKSGAYISPLRPRVRTNTPRQSVQRAQMSTVRNAWLNLSDSQRTDWNNWAALPAQELTNSLGLAYYLSGWQSFIKISLNLMSFGEDPATDAPVDPAPAAPVLTGVNWYSALGVHYCYIEYAYGMIPADHGLFARAAYDQTAATTSPGHLWLKVLADYSPGPTYTDCALGMKALISEPPDGSKAWFDVLIQAPDGQRSSSVLTSAIFNP